MHSLLQDLRYGTRMLAKSPGFSAIAILTVALGIASTSGVFSIVNAALLRPLRYPDADRLMAVWERLPAGFNSNVSAQNYLDWRDQNTVFTYLAATAHSDLDLRGNPPTRLDADAVTPNFFSAVGVQPERGRAFREDEARSPAHVVIISHAIWKSNFGTDPEIIGKAITLNGESWVVVGVMPQGFGLIRGGQVWIPLAFGAEQLNRNYHHLLVVGRLRPGVTVAQANAELTTIAKRLAAAFPETNAGRGAIAIPIRDELVGSGTRLLILILFGAVGFVLLIACANIANLLLAKGMTRQKEIAVRISLGATRIRIVRQLLAENVAIAAAGGLIGLLGAWSGVKYLGQLPVLQTPGAPEVSVDSGVVIFVIAVSALSILVFGLVPAWQISKVNLQDQIKAAARTCVGTGRHERLRGALAIAEVALSLVLVTGAGLMVRSFLKVRQVSPGFNSSNLLTMNVVLAPQRYHTPEAVRGFYDALLARVRALPGIISADISSTLPIIGESAGTPFRRENQSKDASTRQGANYLVVSENYFRTLHMPLLWGRSFTQNDSASSSPVVIINRNLAESLFKGEDPIGKKLIIPTRPVDRFGFGLEVAREVVGVVADVKDEGLDADPIVDIYVPSEQSPFGWEYLVARTEGKAASQVAAVRNAIAAIDRDQPVEDIATIDERISDSLGPRRFSMQLLSLFAAIALLLAAVGTYGVVSYSVAQRTAEIGLRVALGAQPSNVFTMILGKAVILTVVGTAVGTLVSWQ